MAWVLMTATHNYQHGAGRRFTTKYREGGRYSVKRKVAEDLKAAGVAQEVRAPARERRSHEDPPA